MSGFNPATGWTHFTPTKVTRYWRSVDGQPDRIDGRLTDLGLPFYWDASGGLHAHCTEGRLWEILSGRPDTRQSSDSSVSDSYEPEWISITDLGAAFATPLATSTVLKLLRQEGLLERTNGRDIPTTAAVGLYEERTAIPTGRFKSEPGAIQRRWAYNVLVQLRKLAPKISPRDTDESNCAL
jgi:hypothetical protein